MFRNFQRLQCAEQKLDCFLHLLNAQIVFKSDPNTIVAFRRKNCGAYFI